MNTFIFGNQEQAKTAHRAEVPAGFQTKASLLNALSDALRFPDYFGGDWDALEECIRDLPGGDVVLSHEDLPLSQHLPSLSTYLSILKNAAVALFSSGGSAGLSKLRNSPSRCPAFPYLLNRLNAFLLRLPIARNLWRTEGAAQAARACFIAS